MVEELLKLGGERFAIPLVVVVVGATLVKGLFGLHRSHSSDRRDFLDVFGTWEGQSDLWLSAAVRHLFGSYLPPALIRQLMSGPQPGRALLEVSNAWDFLDLDGETQEVHWRRKLLANPVFRSRLSWLLTAAYFASASFALWLGYRTITAGFGGKETVIAWVYVIMAVLGAFMALVYRDNLGAAGKAANRWLGLP